MARAAQVGDRILWVSDQGLPVPATVTATYSTGNVDCMVSDIRAPANAAVLNIAQDSVSPPTAANKWNFATSSGLSLKASSDTTAGDAATVNAACGTFKKDNSGATFTLTNSYITANSLVYAWVQQAAADASALYITNVAVSANTAVFTLNAAPTATTIFAFMVIN